MKRAKSKKKTQKKKAPKKSPSRSAKGVVTGPVENVLPGPAEYSRESQVGLEEDEAERKWVAEEPGDDPEDEPGDKPSFEHGDGPGDDADD